MIQPIVIRFATAGIPEVTNAFAQVRTQATKFEDGMVAAAEKGGRARVGLADREARDKLKATAKVAKDAEKAEQDRTRSEEREAKRRGDIVKRSSEMASRDAVKAAKEEAREIERIRSQESREYIKFSEMRSKAAAREVAEETALRKKAASGAGNYANKWGGRVGGALSMVGGAVGIGGAFMLADAGRKEFSDERKAAQLVNLVTSGTKAPEGANVGNILAQAGQVSRETGIARGDIVEASQVYAKNAQHGDFKGVMGNMGFFAKLSKVTGADMGSIAEAAGTLQSQNPDLDPAAMKQMLLDANEMSKEGKMSFSESLAQMGKVGSTRSSYAGNVADTQRTLIGYAQLAKSGGTADEVGTFVSALAGESTMANKKFKKESGRELFKTDQFGRIANPDTFIEDVIRNTHGNIGQIKGLMGRRGGELFGEVEQSYIDGAGKNNDVEAGIKSVKAYMGGVTATRGSDEGLDAQFAQTMSQPGEKFATSMNKIQQEMEDRLAPALAKFADKLSDPDVEKDIDGLISAFATLAGYLIDLGPFKGLAAIVAARIGADIEQAAIGNSIKAIFTKELSAINTASIAITTATIAVAGTVAAVDADAAAQAKEGAVQAMQGGQTTEATNALGRKVKAGTVTAADLADTQAQLAGAEERRAKLAKGPSTSIIESLAAGAGILTGQSKAVEETYKLKQQENARALKEATDEVNLLKKAAQQAAAALAGITQSAPKVVPPVSAGAPGHPIGSAARSG